MTDKHTEVGLGEHNMCSSILAHLLPLLELPALAGDTASHGDAEHLQ